MEPIGQEKRHCHADRSGRLRRHRPSGPVRRTRRPAHTRRHRHRTARRATAAHHLQPAPLAALSAAHAGGKGITLEQTRSAVRAAKAAGLRVHTPFIFGIPGETYAEGLETIRFACELDPDFASFHALTPFPGSELYERREELGTVAGDLTSYTYQGAAFVPHSMTREEIQRLRQEAYRTFYSRPRYLIRRAAGIRSLHEAGAAWRSARSLFHLWSERDLFSRDEKPQG